MFWRSNKLKISLDAIIKYFAAGFTLSIIITLFFEYLVSVGLALVTSLVGALFGSQAEEEINGPVRPAETIEYDQQDLNQMLRELDYAFHHMFAMLLQNFIFSFLVAAFVEEVCKYFSFYLVEHPDFLSCSAVLSSRPSSYDYGNVEVVHGVAPVGMEMSEVRNRRNGLDTASNEENENESDNIGDGMLDNNSLQATGTKITIAMVAVAAGFACNENISYVFGSSGGNLTSGEF